MHKWALFGVCLLAASITLVGRSLHARMEASSRALHESEGRGDAYVYHPGVHKVHMDVRAGSAGAHDDGYLNAYESLVFPLRGGAVAACLETLLPWTRTTSCERGGSFMAHALRPLWPRKVNVVFHDGSERTWAYSRSRDGYLPVPGSTRDGHGNGIPETIAMASNGGGINAYGFEGPGPAYDRTNLAQRLSSLQIPGNYAGGAQDDLITCAARGGGRAWCMRGP